MNTLVTRELDYQEHDVSHGTYVINQITQMTGGTDVTITTAGGQESIFEIPARVNNYAKSYLRMTSSCPALAVNSTNIFMKGVPHIRQIQFYNKGRVYAVDITDVNKYLETVLPLETKFDELQSSDAVTIAAAPTASNGYCQGMTISNGTAATNYRTHDAAGTAAGAGDRAYVEMRYLGMGATNTVNKTLWHIPLSIFKNTLLAMDKDILFDSPTYLRIVWAPSTQIYFTSTNANDPFTGAAAAVGSCTLSNLNLFLAVEQSPFVEEELKMKLTNGMRITIPFVYTSKINLAAGFCDIVGRYSRGMGKKLRTLYWVPYANTETGLTTYDHNNGLNAGVGLKITDYYVTVNNVRLQQFNVTCANADDYTQAKEQLKGSCIMTSNEFNYNWVYKQSFCNNYSLIERPLMNPAEQQLTDGKPLDIEQIVDIRANTAAQCNHYLFAVVERDLYLSFAGCDLK